MVKAPAGSAWGPPALYLYAVVVCYFAKSAAFSNGVGKGNNNNFKLNYSERQKKAVIARSESDVPAR
jgi:hypothetical protein